MCENQSQDLINLIDLFVQFCYNIVIPNDIFVY